MKRLIELSIGLCNPNIGLRVQSYGCRYPRPRSGCGSNDHVVSHSGMVVMFALHKQWEDEGAGDVLHAAVFQKKASESVGLRNLNMRIATRICRYWS